MSVQNYQGEPEVWNENWQHYMVNEGFCETCAVPTPAKGGVWYPLNKPDFTKDPSLKSTMDARMDAMDAHSVEATLENKSSRT